MISLTPIKRDIRALQPQDPDRNTTCISWLDLAEKPDASNNAELHCLLQSEPDALGDAHMGASGSTSLYVIDTYIDARSSLPECQSRYYGFDVCARQHLPQDALCSLWCGLVLLALLHTELLFRFPQRQREKGESWCMYICVCVCVYLWKYKKCITGSHSRQLCVYSLHSHSETHDNIRAV